MEHIQKRNKAAIETAGFIAVLITIVIAALGILYLFIEGIRQGVIPMLEHLSQAGSAVGSITFTFLPFSGIETSISILVTYWIVITAVGVITFFVRLALKKKDYKKTIVITGQWLGLGTIIVVLCFSSWVAINSISSIAPEKGYIHIIWFAAAIVISYMVSIFIAWNAVFGLRGYAIIIGVIQQLIIWGTFAIAWIATSLGFFNPVIAIAIVTIAIILAIISLLAIS